MRPPIYRGHIELVHLDCVVHAWTGDARDPLEGARRAWAIRPKGFTDWKIEVRRLVAEADIVASELPKTVAHSGKFNTYEPTGKRVEFDAFFMDRVVDGKIVEMWHKPDVLTMLMQIGAVPADAMDG